MLIVVRSSVRRFTVCLAHLLICGSTIGAVSTQARAQQEFKLADDDTWKQISTIDPATPEGQLAQAKAALAAGEPAKAEAIASEWIERYERHPSLPDAYLLRADALAANNDEYKALYDYEYIARMYPGSEAFVTALQRELDIARAYADGKRRKLWGLRWVRADDEAEELFIRIQERMPGSHLAEQAGMELADFYFERSKMALAVDAYALFIENYPRSRQISKARRRLIYAHLAGFKGPEFDAAGLYEARARLRQLRVLEPAEAQRVGADALLTRIDDSDADKMLATAHWYLQAGDPIAAELTIRRLLKKYQRSVAAADALRLIPEILPQLPPGVLRHAPDYNAMRAGLLAEPASSPQASATPR